MSEQIRKIKLGDKIVRGNIVNGFVVGKDKARDYRVIGLNPKIKIQEVVIKQGEEELHGIEEFDWRISNLLQPMFHANHLAHSLFGGDWSHIWVGNF